ncbi:Na(+)/H(+) antiporter subunit D [uncultured Parvibaculum sp.]|mgnify:CR=1 FL=1|uniref:Na(+)/H(+) antiporter subunit D n=1 Tax=uncultured Parvibaculum sp. TaxID=291828 RepID=UPI0030EB349C|tara:strand:+ start:43909 stop:45603 length:1695 start_codon:yes stop_codon:yes gene_type:complete
MPDLLTPALIYIVAALVVPLVPQGSPRQIVMLLVPLAAAAVFWGLPHGTYGNINLMGMHVGLMRVDALSTIFGLGFTLAAIMLVVYAWHVRDTVQQIATLLYAGSAIGAVFAADLITLFVFWEGTAIASVFLIWARRTEGSYAAGMRYLIVQIGSGVILLAGILLYYRETGSIAFHAMDLAGLSTWAILLAFGIKSAFPLLHNWLHDAYPSATVTGTVVLSAFTTKLAIYALVRGFPGTEILIYIGVAMALFPIAYALLENDLRRILTYALNSQLGFMVVGIGIGTPLALNGAIAHALCSIFYQALLFMSVGAVLFRTGSSRASDLGGIARYMPWTTFFCVVGGLSIAALPATTGFVSKSLILSAAGYGGFYLVWLALIAANIGAVMHTSVRLPLAAFFGADRGLRPKEAPAHMLVAMTLAAAVSIGIGIYPDMLYAYLPHDVPYEPYTFTHIVTQLQLIAFAALAFALIAGVGLWPASRAVIILDTDWAYRRLAAGLLGMLSLFIGTAWRWMKLVAGERLERFLDGIYRAHGPQGILARTWPTGSMVLWIAILLGTTLVLTYV